MNVGDTVFVFDINHREYKRDKNGRTVGGPIYAKYFVETKIVGETPRSWIVDMSSRKYKKKPDNFVNGVLTYEQVLEQVYLHDHRYRISEQVKGVNDTTILREVAKLVGYIEEPS